MLYYAIPCLVCLYYTKLCYTILYYTILSYTMLYFIKLCYTMLYYTILCYTILHYTILCYAVLCYIMLYYAIIGQCYNVLYYVMLVNANQCITLHCVASFWMAVVHRCLDESQSDFVELSNFNLRLTDRKMTRMCGSSKDNRPQSFISDGNFFRVTFKTNDLYDASGFNAMYHFRHTDDISKHDL